MKNPIQDFITYLSEFGTMGFVIFLVCVFILFALILSVIILSFNNKDLKKKVKLLKKDNENKEKEIAKVHEKNNGIVKISEKNSYDEELHEEIKKVPTKSNDERTFSVKRSEEPLKVKPLKVTDIKPINRESIPVSNEEKTERPVRIIQDRYEDEQDILKLDEEPIKLEPKAIKDEDYEDEYYDNLNNDGNVSFVEEISKRIEKELEPKAIDLTDYEQQQEDQAVISYKELLRNKDTRIDEDDENIEEKIMHEMDYDLTKSDDDEFLEELKSFRNDL